MCLLCCRRTLAAYAADNDIVGMNGAHRLPNSACVQESSARCTVHTEYTADDGGRAWSQLYTGGITVMYGAVTRGDTELCFKPQPLNEDTREGLVGQTEWSQYFPDCGGSSQSPVDVVTTQTMYIPGLVPVTPLGYSQHGNRPFTLYNNGHTAVIELPEWMGLEGLPWLYTAVQMHLHWGSGGPSHGGSEHTINGLSADAELHVVHYNSELYPNISTAMTQKDGLAVLGILIVTGEETNPAFNSILNYLSRIRHADQKVPIPAFDVQSLLPKDLGRYYRYNGSLTTPPCYQSVLWTLFHERVQISKAQLLKLETILYSSKAEETDRMLLQDNYRATQPLNHRIIFASFSAESGKELSSGEVTAIVIGVMCGCVGLAVIVRFIVKTIRSTSSWDVLPSNRPAPMPRIKEPEKGKEKKQDLALNSTSEAEKKEEPSPSPQTEP
ncbi:carbonic anhydrase 14 isoform X2 [Mugil cephalus]|uniref:carbonic anhydrase 14 isoform X2 n=1 Tax=Mugil cephalus TaxID=48193 RepID=UPI001FB65E7A|nr:carbonic anhydrase 14 isoform X2 [Mugil cephalus]